MLASDLAARLSKDKGWAGREDELETVLEDIILDGEIAALDVGIHLRDNKMPQLSLRVFDRVLQTYPASDLAMYNAAVVASGLLSHAQAKELAGSALRNMPDKLEYRSLYVRSCAITGEHEAARNALKGAAPSNYKERQTLNELTQFVDYCESYPLSTAKSAFGRIQARGSYLEPRAVCDLVLGAVAQKRAFSMVRLGDGEGAWLTLNAHDEGRFNAMYAANRASFLRDWFGSEHLLNDDDFNAFARALQRSFTFHDLIGIPPIERLEQEEGFLSLRGISSAVNVLRSLDLLEGGCGYRRYCSNSINLSLAVCTNFYRDLINLADKIGIITSQKALSGMLKARGKTIAHEYLVPGDSRNFHVNSDGQPECQYPDHLRRIEADLRSIDLSGICFLVAAGFVGKRYLHTIRERGGIAIDLGALADHWAKSQLP